MSLSKIYRLPVCFYITEGVAWETVQGVFVYYRTVLAAPTKRKPHGFVEARNFSGFAEVAKNCAEFDFCVPVFQKNIRALVKKMLTLDDPFTKKLVFKAIAWYCGFCTVMWNAWLVNENYRLLHVLLNKAFRDYPWFFSPGFD